MQNDPPFLPPTFSRPRGFYRLYFLDGQGHISKSHEFFAEDDRAAIKIAEAWREGRMVDLWCRDRRVKKWDVS